MKKVKISQSFVKALMSAGDCHYRINREEREVRRSWAKGLLFEYHLIGATRDGEEEPVILTKTGKLSSDHHKIVAFAEQCKPILESIDMVPHIVQPDWECEVEGQTWSGHPDGLFERKGLSIEDIKYTEEAASRSKWLYDELSLDDRIQATHYVIMSKELYGEYLPFYFIVFFSWGGVEVINAQITPQAIDSYKNLVAELVAGYDETKTSKSFSECAQCTVKDCPFRITKPTIRKSYITDF